MMAARALTVRRSAPASRLSLSDRLLAGSLVWLLVGSWSFGLLLVFAIVGGVDQHSLDMAWWAVGLAVAAIFGTGAPLLRWLRPRVDAVLFSHPDDARVLISQLGRQFHDRPSDRGARTGLTSEIADQIAGRLRLPFVAIVAPGEAEPVAQLDPAALIRLVRLPLTFAGQDVGTLLVTPRARDRRLADEDRALLDDLAVQIGIALHALRVTDDLQASRAAVITAREEERRRIRRDLHDGLGPALASLRLQLAALEHLIPARQDEAMTLVERLRAEVRDTSAQIRGLVYDLRPPTLDEFGLLGAIRTRAAGLADAGVDMRVEVAQPLPELPAAAEVALFRIASEALANAGRHAGARTALLRIWMDDGTVCLQLDDDGRGLPETLVPGVGISGMRERAEELRGTLEVVPRSPGPGTSVRVRLPVTTVSENPDGTDAFEEGTVDD